MKPISRVGLIGAGYWGPNLARNLAETENAELVVVADLDQAKLDKMKEHFPDIITTRIYQDLFKHNLDAVVIATPPITHYSFAAECIENGLHVLVEKPLVLNSVQGEKLIQLAQKKQRVLMVGHTFEYNPAVHTVKEIIDSGELGEIYYIDAVRANLGLFQPNVNAMWDLAPHDISIILYLLGQPPTSVSSEGGSFVLKKINVHDIVYMHMRFPKGILATIRLSWLDPNKTRRITVVGSKKMLIYDDIETSEKVKVYDKGVDPLPFVENFEAFQCSYRFGDVTAPHIEWEEPLKLEVKHFLDCIHNGTTPQSDGESGLRVVRVLEAAQKSLQGGVGGQVEVLSPYSEQQRERRVVGG
jgi:predicted dehydrogenase